MARALNGMATNTAAAANLSTLKTSKFGPIRRHGKLHEIAAKFFHLVAAPRRMLQPGHFALELLPCKSADLSGSTA
jgi:hypothetical protein